jgi:hypothetical protein
MRDVSQHTSPSKQYDAHTVPSMYPQASAFVLFPDIMAACEAANVLRVETSVDAVEMFDRASLRECSSNESMTKLVPDIIGENTPLLRTHSYNLPRY